MKCPACGVENHDNARFCKSCAAPQVPQVPQAPTPPPAAPPVVPPPVRLRHHRQPHEDLVGLLGFAFFLAAVAVVFAQNPSLIEGLRTWSREMSVGNTIFVRPPDPVIVSAAWFFGVMGGLEFIGAGLRWSLRWPPLRVTSLVLAGFGDLIVALLLLRYADRAISGAFLLTVLVGVAAAFLMIYITLGIYWASSRKAPWSDSLLPSARP